MTTIDSPVIIHGLAAHSNIVQSFEEKEAVKILLILYILKIN